MGRLFCSGVGRLVLGAVLVAVFVEPLPAFDAPFPVAPEQAGAKEDAIRDAIERIPVLAEVSIRLIDGSRVTGLVRAKGPESLTVRPKKGKGREVVVPLSSIRSVKMKRPDQGIGAGKAIVIGAAAGASAFVLLLLIALSNAGA